MRPLRPSLVAAAALLLLSSPAAVADDAPAPFDVALRVVYDGAGHDSFREEVELQLVAALDVAHCFPRLVVLDPGDDPVATALGEGADLLLEVVLSDLEDELEYDISQAQRDSPDATPDVARQHTARLEVDVAILLSTLDPPGRLVRDRSMRVRRTHRPNLYEDPRTEALFELLDEISGSVERLVCKGKPSKMVKQVEQARAGAGG